MKKKDDNTPQITLYEKYGEVRLESPEMNLKILSNRELYIQRPDKNAHTKVEGVKVPKGLSADDKMIWLVRYRELLIENLSENPPVFSDESSIPSSNPSSADDRLQSKKEQGGEKE